MTLTTHAIVGAAAASLIPSQPLVGFVLGFASHFCLDSIPHWAEGDLLRAVDERKKGDFHNVKLHSGKDLVHDVLFVGTDSLLGFIGAIFILVTLFQVPLYIVLLGAFAGQMPDGLQFLYFKFHPRFMDRLQSFHSRIQTEHANIAYLGIEAGLILTVIAAGILGVFML